MLLLFVCRGFCCFFTHGFVRKFIIYLALSMRVLLYPWLGSEWVQRLQLIFWVLLFLWFHEYVGSNIAICVLSTQASFLRNTSMPLCHSMLAFTWMDGGMNESLPGWSITWRLRLAFSGCFYFSSIDYILVSSYLNLSDCSRDRSWRNTTALLRIAYACSVSVFVV